MQHKLTNCILCNSDKLDKLIELNSTPLGDSFKKNKEDSLSLKKYDLTLMLCDKCKQIQLSTIVDPEDVYDEDYLYTTDISLGLSEHFNLSAKNIISRFKLISSDLVIEIGSNKGIMLKAFQKNNINVLGIEPAKYAVTQAIKMGVDTINDFFTTKVSDEIIANNKNVKVILANNVIANIPNLSEVFKSIEKLLIINDGVFIFETSYSKDVVDYQLVDTIYHEHISYLSLNAIENSLNQFGLRLFDAQYIDTKGGSIRGYVSVFNSSLHKKTNQLEKLLQEEKETKFYTKNDIFYQNLDSLKDSVKEYISFLTEIKHKVICYGASVGCTTMLYNCGLEDCDILLDDNKSKIDKYSPGLGIKVYNSDYIYDNNVKYIIVLAWRYIEQISKKHKSFLDNGGKFLVVELPTCKLVEYKNG